MRMRMSVSMPRWEEEKWVGRALGNDTLVADLLLHMRHHRSSFLRRWARRQPRTPRLSVLASPTTPLNWAHHHSPRSNSPSTTTAVDKSETPADKESKKMTMTDLQEEEKEKLTERKKLKNELAALKLTFDQKRGDNENLKRIKHELISRGILETGPTDRGTYQCDPLTIAPQETVQEKIHEENSTDEYQSPVDAAASAPSKSKQQEICRRAPLFLLPDLNQPPEGYLANFLGLY